MRQVFIDLKTTGLSPDLGARIIQLAALEMEASIPTGRTLLIRVDPECEIEPKASSVHGIYNYQVTGCPSFADVGYEVFDFLTDSEVVLYKAESLGFLDDEFSRLNKPRVNDCFSGFISVLDLARKKLPGVKKDIKSLCDRFEIDRSQVVHNGPLANCEILAKVFLRLSKL